MGELHVVAVLAGVEVRAVADDLGVDVAGLVGVDQALVGQRLDVGDLLELVVPVRLHVSEVLRVTARGLQRSGGRERVAVAEPVGRDGVVVVHGLPGRHPGRRVGQSGQPRRGVWLDGHRLRGRVVDREPAVDHDVPVASDGDGVSEVGDLDPGTGAVEGRDERRQVAVGVDPGGRRVVVGAVPEGHVLAVAHVEAAPQAGHDAVLVARPADQPRVAERAGHRHVRLLPAGVRRRRGGLRAGARTGRPGGDRGDEAQRYGDRGEQGDKRAGCGNAHDESPGDGVVGTEHLGSLYPPAREITRFFRYSGWSGSTGPVTSGNFPDSPTPADRLPTRSTN